ncbi:major facilitator superfamily domain-containing protein [Xylogone sp. PMI_703]|nr:major facilitator superfamily domain-containing protein [Xylogone sp. PMI_703]
MTRLSHWRILIDQAGIVPEVVDFPYRGSGTSEDPFQVTWIPDDSRNPQNFSMTKKWLFAFCVSFSTLAVAFSSSSYTGGIKQIVEDFHVGQEVAILGVSLFVLGFVLGPLLWGPLSEMYGRQSLFILTYGGLTIFNATAAASQNIWTLLILRFLAGTIGSSPLTNAGGAIADLFSAEDRGIAMSVFASAPFLGPSLGPIIGGFLGQSEGWRWVEGLMGIFAGTFWILQTLTVPETYAPVLLRKRAEKLSALTGKVYKTKKDIEGGHVKLKKAYKIALSRPWLLLIFEPIVLLLTVYMAIINGTLYMLFAAFPIVFQEVRGWNQGVGGLAFLGVMIGMMLALVYSVWDNKRYRQVVKSSGGFALPEARLPPGLVGSIAIPVGMFWFAWTNYPSIHWMASISGGVPFGFGMVVVFLSVLNYLVDAYTIYAASVLAANSVLRSLFGAIFPLFTTYMYHNLGIHWASSIPAFLALACVPFPFLFYKFGGSIRARCKYAAEAAQHLAMVQEQSIQNANLSDSNGSAISDDKV